MLGSKVQTTGEPGARYRRYFADSQDEAKQVPIQDPLPGVLSASRLSWQWAAEDLGADQARPFREGIHFVPVQAWILVLLKGLDVVSVVEVVAQGLF